jgi:TonB family protein
LDGILRRDSEFDRPPQLLKAVPPEYPQTAQQSGGEGQVTLRIEVKADGTIGSTVPLEGHPDPTDAALKSARQFLFEPAQWQDHPVSLCYRRYSSPAICCGRMMILPISVD